MFTLPLQPSLLRATFRLDDASLASPRARRTEACVGEAVVPCVDDGQGLRWAYDDGDRLVSEGRWSPVTSAWVESTTTYNDLGWATGLEHPDATTESWEYDALGRLREHLDAASVSRTWEYDGWGRLARESIPGLVNDRVHNYSFGWFPSAPPARPREAFLTPLPAPPPLRATFRRRDGRVRCGGG